MKFGQLIKYSMRNIFFKEHAENEVGRLLYSRSFLFFKKVLYEIKLRGQHISFLIFWLTSTWTCNINRLYKISDCWPRRMLHFGFIIHWPGTSSFSTFWAWVFQNIFSRYITSSDQILCALQSFAVQSIMQ